MKPIKIQSQFGHEIMAIRFAAANNLDVCIIPNKENKEEYEAEAKKIFDNMSFFYPRLQIVPFEEQNSTDCRDIIGELKAGTLKKEEWKDFFKGAIWPTRIEGLPEYRQLKERSVLFVPQKLISDGACGVTAQEQSLAPEFFEFIKGMNFKFVLGQHFNKVADRKNVEQLAQEFELYVPGMTENSDVFGIRGVKHEMYYNLYRHLWGSIGIAGTHTWYLLAMFPEIPQVIFYNKKGVEDWQAIAEAAREAGHEIYALGFDDEQSDFEALTEEAKYLMVHIF